MSLDLKMGYYNIRLCEEASNICTTVLTRVKYWYKHIPVGVCNYPGIFKDKMNNIFRGFGFIRLYINGLIITTKGDCNNHLVKL